MSVIKIEIGPMVVEAIRSTVVSRGPDPTEIVKWTGTVKRNAGCESETCVEFSATDMLGSVKGRWGTCERVSGANFVTFTDVRWTEDAWENRLPLSVEQDSPAHRLWDTLHMLREAYASIRGLESELTTDDERDFSAADAQMGDPNP